MLVSMWHCCSSGKTPSRAAKGRVNGSKDTQGHLNKPCIHAVQDYVLQPSVSRSLGGLGSYCRCVLVVGAFKPPAVPEVATKIQLVQLVHVPAGGWLLSAQRRQLG